MKKFKLFKMLAVLVVLITSVNAAWAWEERTYDGSTKLYISNIKPNGWSSGVWASDDSNRMFVYLEYNNSGGSYWMEATLEVSSNGKYNKGALYSVTPTSGTYKYFKIARGSSSSSISNETSKCQFVSGGGNFITHYKEGNGDSQITWGSIDPRSITSDGSGVLYFDIDPSGCSWWKNDGGDYKFAYFFNDETSAWSNHSEQVSGDYYKVNVPAGTWKGVVLTRQKVTSNPTWEGDNGVNNQTADIPFNHGKNYLSNFVPNDFDYILSWDDFVPSGDTLLNGTMNNWELITAKRFSKGELAITLPARKTMSFKIVEGNNGGGTWYGLTDANCILSDMTDWGFSSSGTNTRINTAGEGPYTFAYNASHQLSVTYPEVTHPNADYVYMIKYEWDSWRVHFQESSTTYGIAKTTWTGQELTVSSGTITDTYDYTAPGAGSSQTYFYYAVGDYPKFNFNDNSGSNQTNDQTPYPGQYIHNVDKSWVWGRFEFAVTLNTNDGTINAGNVTSYEFGVGATLPTNVTRPGYTFGGWYDNSGLTGSAVTEITETDNTAKEYWAKWTPVEMLTFRSDAGSSDWGTSSNWNPACVPTIEHNVTIQKAVVVNSAAFAKSVVIDQTSSSSVKLTINAGKSLVIAGTLQKKNGSGTGHTEEADVLIDSDLSNGNGALIMGEHDGNNEATVNFATKAYKKEGESKNWVNQYIGTPFNDQGDPTYNYYGMELYAFDAAIQAWEDGLASSMTPFYGYDLLSNSSTPNVVLNMTGTLVASSTQNLTGLSYAESPYENVLANSWVAPIVIDEFVDEDFTNLKKTIYIFNAGSLSDYESNSGAIADDKNTATQVGQYTSIPINLSPFYDNYKTIPSMQSFSVIATGSSPSLRLRYKELVYDPASTSVLIEPNHAPKRVNGVKPEIVKVYVTGESGYGDKIWLVERTDFTTGYDDGWEAEKLYGILEAPQLYAVVDEDNMAVIALPDVDNTVLGFQAGTEDSQYTFLFDYEGEEELYLYDTQAEKETRITSDATYSFTTTDKVAHNRFVIRKSAKMPTGVENTTDEGVKARKQLIDGALYIIRDGKLYNATGALVK